MGEHASDALKIVAGIIMAVVVISFVIIAVNQALSAGKKGLNKTSELTTTLDETSYTQYDGALISGDQLIGVISSFSSDIICIKVDNHSTVVNYVYDDSLTTKQPSSLLAAAQKKGNPAYITPTSQFLGTLVRDPNTQGITGITFEIQ